MSRIFNGENCYMCPCFNPKNTMGEECESDEHSFCNISLEKHDKEIYNQALEDFFNKCLEENIQFYLNPIDCMREVKEQLKR